MRIKWNALTLSLVGQAKDDRNAWGEIYDQICPALEFGKRLLDLELDAYARQSGKGKLASWAVRVKDRESFITKMVRIANSQETKSQFEAGHAFTIFDIINDLIGARQVFYFERDIQDAVLFWMSFPSYRPLEVTHWVQDVSGYDTDLPAAAKWIQELPGSAEREGIPPKQSGYESLHFILGLDLDVLAARIIVADRRLRAGQRQNVVSFAQLMDGLRTFQDDPEMLECLTFELQCRTILEHAWAEIEHRSRYSIDKALPGSNISSGRSPKRYRNYKAILRAAQIFQNSLKPGFDRWDKGGAALSGRSTSINIGPRDTFWDESIRAKLSKLNDAFAVHSESARRATCVNDAEVEWRKLYNTYTDVLTEIGSEKELIIKPEQAKEEYGRRRLLVQLLGFILAYAPDRNTPEGEPESAKRTTKDLAASLYLRSVPSLSRSINWISPSTVVVRLYEHLRILDAFHCRDDPSSPIYDPLVDARAASVYFRHYGALRRSTSLLRTALDRLRKSTQYRDVKAQVVSAEYLLYRLTENYWTAYNLEGRQFEDLCLARQFAKEAYSAITGAESAMLPLRQKIAAHIVTMELLWLTETARRSNRDGSAMTSGEEQDDRAWKRLGELRTSLGDLVSDLTQTLDSEDSEASLRLQGKAILIASDATNGPDTNQVNRRLVEARRIMRLARRNIARKVGSAGYGGSLGFHATVAMRVEKFIYSLCSDDWKEIKKRL